MDSRSTASRPARRTPTHRLPRRGHEPAAARRTARAPASAAALDGRAQAVMPSRRRCSSRSSAPSSRGCPRGFALRPVVEHGAMRFEAHEGHGVSARVGHPLHVDGDHRPHARAMPILEVLGERVEPGSSSKVTWPRPWQPHDARRPLEGAEHDHDPAVLLQVGDCFTPEPVWSVGDTVRPEHSELAPVALGEQFTWPEASSGAVATKKTGWVTSHCASRSSIWSYVLPCPQCRAVSPKAVQPRCNPLRLMPLPRPDRQTGRHAEQATTTSRRPRASSSGSPASPPGRSRSTRPST